MMVHAAAKRCLPLTLPNTHALTPWCKVSHSTYSLSWSQEWRTMEALLHYMPLRLMLRQFDDSFTKV